MGAWVYFALLGSAVMGFLIGWAMRGRGTAPAHFPLPAPSAKIDDDLTGHLSVLQAQQQALLDSIDDLVWLKDTEGRFLVVNRKFREIFGLEPRAVVGLTDFDLVAPHIAARYQEDDRRVVSTGESLRQEEKIQRSASEMGWGETVKVPVFNGEGAIIGTAGFSRDVTLRKRYEQQADFLANHDPLTGLHNRRHLEDGFSDYATQFPRFAALFLDLDNFKLVNDTDGHSLGDELLRLLAQRLRRAGSSEDMLVRLGGDEFLILTPLRSSDTTSIDMLAQQIQEAISAPYLIGGTRHAINCSIGIALFPEHGDDRQTLIKHADIAMFEAKKAGRNRHCWFHDRLASDAARSRAIELRLREALESNAFELHYQAVWDTRTRTLIGAEALLRLRDRDGRPISPAQFIPVAEASGMIEAIGAWVLHTGLRQLRAWRDAGHTHLRLAINISGTQFASRGFSEHVAQWLAEAGVPGEALELELTEGVLMAHIDSNFDVLDSIRKLGVQLAVDDFGTGYSSLAYLKRLPIHRLKIDRSFVDGLPENAGDIAITRSILHLAQTFQLEVTAEGVETEAQLEFLRNAGCPAVQGYLLGRPVPAAEFEALLRPA